jgi:hypothetical protein
MVKLLFIHIVLNVGYLCLSAHGYYLLHSNLDLLIFFKDLHILNLLLVLRRDGHSCDVFPGVFICTKSAG